MSEGVTIRSAREPDAEAVAAVWFRSRMASVPAIPPPVHSDAEILAWIGRLIVSEADVWVAISRADEVVAMLVVDGDSIDQLYVDPDSTGMGIGSMLVDLAKRERRGGLRLWTFQANLRARAFYEAHGFVATAWTDGDNEEGATDVQYCWGGIRQS